MGATRLRNAPVIDRLLFHTERTSGCWLWLGSTNTKGYGHIRGDNNGPLLSVHRVAYEHYIGPIPSGLEIDHLCRNRSCVNPEHLEAVDHATNVRRRLPATHCKYGHEFTDDTKRDGRGRRWCRRCATERMRAWRAQRGT